MRRRSPALSAFAALLLAAAPAFCAAPKAKRKRAKPKASVSAKGNVTGAACADDADCEIGCAPIDPKTATCLSKKEASPKCLVDGTAQWGPGGLRCACLPDVKRCGFAYPK